MTQEEIRIIAEKINHLAPKRPNNPCVPTPPPGFPRIGPYRRPRAMDSQQAAINIRATVKNMLKNDLEIDQYLWEKSLNIAKSEVIRFAEKCWHYCNDEEALDIIKMICSMEGISFPPKFKSSEK